MTRALSSIVAPSQGFVPLRAGPGRLPPSSSTGCPHGPHLPLNLLDPTPQPLHLRLGQAVVERHVDPQMQDEEGVLDRRLLPRESIQEPLQLPPQVPVPHARPLPRDRFALFEFGMLGWGWGYGSRNRAHARVPTWLWLLYPPITNCYLSLLLLYYENHFYCCFCSCCYNY